MAKFLTGNDLFNEVYDIIFNAKSSLLILSPFIKLDEYFKEAVFKKHLGNPELSITIAFGKNEKNVTKSFSKTDFDYFKQFPNISVIYIPNLHAKFYANESKGIVTSINLYDYSFKNNVEYGVMSETKFFGSSIDDIAWDETMDILETNFAVYIKRPTFKKKLILGRDYMGSSELLDLTGDLLKGKKIDKINFNDFEEEIIVGSEKNTNVRMSREEFEENIGVNYKLVSATVLGKSKNLNFNQVLEKMLVLGFVDEKKNITELGKSKGLKMKSNQQGSSWIVYPENVSRFL